MPLPPSKVAFVAGCSGVSGNAIVEHLIRTPKEEWSKIVISSRSPLKSYWQDPRVVWVAVDFLAPIQKIKEQLRLYCADVTHAFFTSYVHSDDFAKLRELNEPLFKNFLTSIDDVAGSSLQRVVLQTGGKHYGVHLGPAPTPLSEDMPRYEDHGENFYYPQEDFLFELQAKRKWHWNVIRPNQIIGFTPGKNGMSNALSIAMYMITCKEEGTIPWFPGNKFFYNSCDDSSFAPSIADLSVWAATHEHTRNEAFNSVNGDHIVWRYFWKRLGEYFGVEIPDQTQWKALGLDGVYEHEFKMGNWAKDKQHVWDRVCEKYGGSKDAFASGTWGFMDWTLGKAWPTMSTMTKARKFGFNRYDDSFEAWTATFRMLENAGILPARERIIAASS